MQEHTHEVHILLTASDEFGNSKIMHLQAPTGRTAGILIFDGHQPLYPACRQRGGGLVHP
jgi:hypothetical protein